MSYLYLLDTNIISELIKNPRGVIFSKIQNVGEDTVCTSIIVACESRFGAKKKNSQKLIEKLEIILDSIEILPLTHPVEQYYAGSQTGETATELRKILNKDGIESAIAAQLLEDELEEDDLSDEAKQRLLKEQISRTKQPNLSYFAFTATPKHKTQLVFDEPGDNGQVPFHLYTMRQAIEEGYISLSNLLNC